ncbi:type 1 fimbrial protein [Erwinia tracheiphila]|uniref:Fimbrial-type adhesion domain-containing protein n=1 Tax=Erwinia tracheiphila TaxID=65700 RepID=A0A0M2KDN3_9GAMM|nr:fimbrial protein [Erwinia tracheiphila]EOS95795.1 hypothetical protein ETR_06290 [Erwinia tracheiphila PSU-1]KKF37475.1 hypothetical protein SY86_22070 [Erwinia tracheiphila]UIA88878.1 type 1 fimbrial protein [Erwinia tracheiphila]UIA97259.1 type 1 fimbrial protein [Erwinia tracheiphila]
MKMMPGTQTLFLTFMLLAASGSSSFAASCETSHAMIDSPFMPLQGGAITVGPDVSNGTIIWSQRFKPTSPVEVKCKEGFTGGFSIKGNFTTAPRPTNWSDGRFPPGSVYQTDIPGIGMAIYAYGNTHYTVPFNYLLTGTSNNNYTQGWIPHSGIEFDVVLIKTGVIIPGRVGGENLPGINYNLHADDGLSLYLGSLKFSGSINIISKTCTTPDIIVPMGDYEIVRTFTHPGSYSSWQDASIKLIDCPRFHGMIRASHAVEPGNQQQEGKISNSIQLTLSPNTSVINSAQGIFGVKSGTNSASGVGLQLAWGKQGDPSPRLVNFGESQQYLLPDDGSTQISLPLLARYIQTSPQVTPGKADATVTFTIYYY